MSENLEWEKIVRAHKVTDAEYAELRRNFPRAMGDYSHESLTEMIFDMDRGFTTSRLDDRVIDEYKKSPRMFLIKLLEREYLGAKKCLEILEAL